MLELRGYVLKLFAIRTDKEAVLKILQQIEPKIVEVLKITIDTEQPAYIQFDITVKH